MPVSVRYIVSDVDAVIPFYVDRLGFAVDMHPAPGFAALSRGELRLLLNRPGAGGAGQAMPDGAQPQPGGWNRIQIEVDDLGDGLATAGRRRAVPQRDRDRQRGEADPGRGPVGEPDRALPAVLGSALHDLDSQWGADCVRSPNYGEKNRARPPTRNGSALTETSPETG